MLAYPFFQPPTNVYMNLFLNNSLAPKQQYVSVCQHDHLMTNWILMTFQHQLQLKPSNRTISSFTILQVSSTDSRAEIAVGGLEYKCFIRLAKSDSSACYMGLLTALIYTTMMLPFCRLQLLLLRRPDTSIIH